MLRFALILVLAGLLSAPAFAADPAPAPAALDNLGGKGKPCKNHEGGPGMMMKSGQPCPNKMGGGCDCKHHAEMSERIRQLEKRVYALQMALEAMAKR
jgi:hypothetical protein